MKRALMLAAIVCASGCTLLPRGAPLSVRYFALDAPPPRLTPAAAPNTRPTVRLGRVRGADHLRERIVYRDSQYEVGFYDDREWTERPEVYVRRALARKLFEERGFERATGGAAPTLDVDVIGFEEVRTPGVHAAHVELRYELRDDDRVLEERTIAIDRRVAGERFEEFVAAISEALDEAVDRIADRVSDARIR